ncbi:hypothetical protein JL721_8341 [Aureococcus anophagefferens]|nr:hypothetical protein JL721_8341 [Aureococcus anophagefferens]
MDDVAPALAVASSDGVSNPKLKETLEVMRRLRAKKAPTAPYEINAESLYRQAEAIFAMREKLAARTGTPLARPSSSPWTCWAGGGGAGDGPDGLRGADEGLKTEHDAKHPAARVRRGDGQLEKACATCERLARRSDLAADATIDVYLRSGRTLLALRRALRGNRWLDPEPDDEAAAEETRPRQRTQSMQAVQQQVEATARAASADEGSSAMMEVFATKFTDVKDLVPEDVRRSIDDGTASAEAVLRRAEARPGGLTYDHDETDSKFPQPLCRGEMRLARDDVEDRKRRRGLRKALRPPACVVEWREPAPEHRRKRVALVGCLDDEASKAQLERLDATCEAETVGARLTREAAALLATAHRVAAIRAELARRDWEVFLRLVKTFETDVETRALELRFGAEDGMHLAIRDATALVADEIAFYRAAVVERDQAKARLLKAFDASPGAATRRVYGSATRTTCGRSRPTRRNSSSTTCGTRRRARSSSTCWVRTRTRRRTRRPSALRNLRRAKRALQRRHLANLKDARRAKAELDACAARQREDGDAWPEDARELDLVLQWATFMLASLRARGGARGVARAARRARGRRRRRRGRAALHAARLPGGPRPALPDGRARGRLFDADHDDFVGGLTDDGDEADRADAVKAAVGDAVDALAAAEGAAAFWSVKRLRAALGDARAVLDAVDGAARDVMARRVDVAAAMLLLRRPWPAATGTAWRWRRATFLDVAADDFDPLFAALAAPLRKRTFRQRAKKRASGLGFLARARRRRGRASTTQSVLCDLDARTARAGERGGKPGEGVLVATVVRRATMVARGARGSGVPDLPAAMRVAADAVRDAAAIDASTTETEAEDEVPADGPAVTFGTQTLNLDAPPAKRVIRFAPEAGAAEDGGGGETEPEKSVARALNAIGSGTAYVRHSPRAVAELTCVRYETLVRECGARLDLAGHLGADLATECLAADKDPKRALGRDCDDVLAALDAMAKAYCQPSRVDDHRHDAGVALRDAKTLLDALELLYEGHGSLPGSYKALQRRASVGALVLSCRHALRDERWHAIDAAVKLVLEAVGDTHTCLQGAREPDGRFRVAPRAHDDVDVYGPEGRARDAARKEAAAIDRFARTREACRLLLEALDAAAASETDEAAQALALLGDDVTDYAGFDDLFPPGDDEPSLPAPPRAAAPPPPGRRARDDGVLRSKMKPTRDELGCGAGRCAAARRCARRWTRRRRARGAPSRGASTSSTAAPRRATTSRAPRRRGRGRAARVTLLRDDVDPVVLRGRRRGSRGSARPTSRAACGRPRAAAVLEPPQGGELDAPDTLDDLDVDWFHLGQLFVAAARDADRRADAAERLAALRGVVDMIDRKPSRANARNAAHMASTRRASAGLIAYLFTQTMREELVWPEDDENWAQVNRILKPLAAALVAYREAPNPQGHFYSTVGNVMQGRAVIVTLNVDGLAASSGLPVHEVHGVLAPLSPDGHEVTTTRERYQELAVADGPVVDGAGNQLAPKVALYDNTQFKRDPFQFQQTNPFSEIGGTPKVLIIVGLSGDTEMVELMIKESKTTGITKICIVDRENNIPPDLLKAFNDLPHCKQRIIHFRTTADAFASYLEAAAPSLDG